MGAFLSKSTIHSDPSTLGNKKGSASPSSQHYDYIIVGGGTAGCVLASRLSENPNITVLLIEAGKSHEGDLLTTIPLAFSKLFRSEVDWNYRTTSQQHFAGRQCYWPRGKILGGSSATNCLIYHRCSPEDFEEWAQLGNIGWSYEDVLPYFLKAEGFSASTSNTPKEHGTEGPWKIGYQHHPPAGIHRVIMETCKTLGVPILDDLCTSSGTMGAADALTFTDPSGKRSSTATAYLTPDVLSRSNLFVLVNCVVEQIIFDRNNAKPRAVGVEFSASPTGPKYVAQAKREVVLSAGAIASPQLLMVSGIGPRATLQKLGIDVVQDLPSVGQHMSDHVSCGTLILRTKTSMNLTWDNVTSPLRGLQALVHWLINGKGPMAGLSFPGFAFVKTETDTFSQQHVITHSSMHRDNPVNSPDLEIVWTPLIILDEGAKRPPSGYTGVSMGAMVMRPASEGFIEPLSRSMWDKPAIDPRYLTAESDSSLLVAAVRFILKMAHTEPLCSVIEKDLKNTPWLFPGNTAPEKLTDHEIKEWIRVNGMPSWHPSSTCRMGPSPVDHVTDYNLKVHGVDGLRIVDNSAFPTQISGHPCSVVVMMAEKAADMM
ncbi:GMC oxidoreductase, partial [Dendrothele bispora CBS 962.96]